MTRSELINKIAESFPGLHHSVIQSSIETVFECISDSLGRGERVELRGFGAFIVKERGSRRARNPRTGEPVDVSPKYALLFKSGKELHEKMNADS